jgi:hypothetical protein
VTIRLNRRARIASAVTMCLAPLTIKRTTLVSRMKKLGIDPSKYRADVPTP